MSNSRGVLKNVITYAQLKIINHREKCCFQENKCQKYDIQNCKSTHKDNTVSHIYDSQILRRESYVFICKMKVNMKLFMRMKKANQSGKVCKGGDKKVLWENIFNKLVLRIPYIAIHNEFVQQNF